MQTGPHVHMNALTHTYTHTYIHTHAHTHVEAKGGFSPTPQRNLHFHYNHISYKPTGPKDFVTMVTGHIVTQAPLGKTFTKA